MNTTSLFRLLLILGCLAIGIPALAQTSENHCVNENGKVFPVGNGITPPIIILKKKPAAPEKNSSEDGKGKKTIDGTVVLLTIVGTNGDVCDAKVVRSAGKDLDEKALDTVKQWKFKPALKKGKPVSVGVYTEITFHLDK